MLFVWPARIPVGLWMRNTYLPLSVAFLDDDGKIVGFADMEPFDEVTVHRSPVPVRYALEVHYGWFRQRRVEVGDRVEMRMPGELAVR
jgi:hypothetical protein